MNKTFVIAAGLLALAGAAMADQAVLVDGKLHTPAGDVPLEQSTGGIPVPSTGVPTSDGVDQANAALSGAGVPLGMRTNDHGLRPNLKCSGLKDANPNGALDGTCSNEPTVPYPSNDVLSVGPNGVTPSQWVSVDSGSVFTQLPPEVKSQLPADQQKALQDANDAVNMQAAAAMVDDSQRNANGAHPRFFAGAEELLQSGKLASLLGGVGVKAPALGDGKEQQLPDGFEQQWNGDAPGLASNVRGDGGQLGADSTAQGANGGTDLGTMAIAAAVVGGAIFAPLALYHRIRSNNALNNKTRQMVFDAVVRAPGSGVNDAAKAANCSYSTAAYHLERLVEERLLICSEDGRRARYFKNGGAFSQSEREFVPILQSKECMDVLQVIVENPWCYRAEVAQKLSVSGPTVNWHLKKLMNVGVVKEMREGRVSYLYADKKVLNGLGANLIGKLPDELISRLRFENKPEPEFVEPAMALPETTVPEIGVGEYDGIELAPLAETAQA